MKTMPMCVRGSWINTLFWNVVIKSSELLIHETAWLNLFFFGVLLLFPSLFFETTFIRQETSACCVCVCYVSPCDRLPQDLVTSNHTHALLHSFVAQLPLTQVVQVVTDCLGARGSAGGGPALHLACVCLGRPGKSTSQPSRTLFTSHLFTRPVGRRLSSQLQASPSGNP